MGTLKFDQIASRESAIKSAHTTTCNWLLDHRFYREWSDPKAFSLHRGFLWISGKPGSGKSTIMKFLTTLAKRKICYDGAIATFFFNARGVHLEKSTEGMFRSVLLQLLERFPDLQEVLDDTGLIPRANNSCPSLEILEILLRKASSMLGRRSFTCFIDALDECDEDQVRDMVEYFEDLGQQVGSNLAQFRICFSSRHYPYVHLQHGFRLVLEDQKGHKDDLAKYVRSRLRADPSPQIDELCDQILQKAAGVFMWVVLVVDILNKELQRGRVFAAKKRLQQIPEKLSDVFRDMIRRDDRDMEDTFLCIHWILYSKQPLSPEELFYAVCSGLSPDDLAEAVAVPITREIANKFVISSSKGLAEVTKSSYPTVQFIHESVRDFLLKENGVRELWPELGGNIGDAIHERLRDCCHTYWVLAVSRSTSLGQLHSESEPDVFALRQKVRQEHPFLEYAVGQVLWHANAAAKTICQNTFLEMFPLRDWISLNNLYHQSELVQHQYTLGASLLYILADRCFPHLIRDRRRRNPCIDIPGEQFSYPFFAALIGGHQDAIRALLGLDVYENDIIDDLMSATLIGLDIRETPLTWAAQGGLVTLAELLIKSGGDVNCCDANGSDPLSVAAANGHQGVLKLLLRHGADVHSREGPGYRATLVAAKNGHIGALQLLIESGVDMHSEHGPARRAMCEAARRGHESIVILLIGNGVNLGSPDGPGPTALFEAAQNGHAAIVKLLLEHGVAADAQCGRALSLAARHGHGAIVKVLIEYGADTKSGRSLVAAARNGHEPIVKMLLENGADAGASRAMSVCIKNGHTGIVELLAKHGGKISGFSADSQSIR
jgi:ankyrin repeat protein